MTTTLTQQQADTIREACYNLCDARPMAYSGRAMYGTTCLGVVMDGDETFTLAVEIYKEDPDLARLLADKPSRADSMGRDKVVIYWESVRVDGTDLDDDDEDEED